MVCLLREYGNGATWREGLIVNQIIIVRIDNVGNVVILLVRNGQDIFRILLLRQGMRIR